jgi:hypothetical protein
MTEYIGIGFFVLAVFLFIRWLTRPRGPEETTVQGGGANPTTLLQMASELYEFFNAAGKTSDVLANQQFRDMVEYMSSSGYSNQELLEYYRGENMVLACAAMVALGFRPDGEDLVQPVLEPMNSLAYWTREFALQCLDRRYDQDVQLVAPLLAKADASWQEPVARTILKDFIHTRLDRGEKPNLAPHLDKAPGSPGEDPGSTSPS